MFPSELLSREALPLGPCNVFGVPPRGRIRALGGSRCSHSAPVQAEAREPTATRAVSKPKLPYGKSFTLASHNAQGMERNSPGLKVLNKREEIMDWMTNRKVDCLAVQEIQIPHDSKEVKKGKNNLSHQP